MKRLRSRGRGLFRQEFYSICSMHSKPQDDCDCCNAGSWRNVYATMLSHTFYKVSPFLWRWWANRPNSKSRKRLEEIFPNLKNEK
jgi:hypothetical protein